MAVIFDPILGKLRKQDAGVAGPAGANGQGVPTGGSASQVLTKVTAADYDTSWTTVGTLSDGDKGDITVSSSGAVWTVDPSAITLAKQANVATGTVFYRKTAGTGVPEVQTLATLKTDLGLTGTNSGDQTTIVGITGTLAEFNTALTGYDFATGGGTATGINTGDQTSIVGITGTKAQFDTAVTDGNILYVGDVTQYTDELAQDAVGVMVDASLTYVDVTPLLQRAALTGAITAAAGSNATLLGSFTTTQLNAALSDNDVAVGGGTATGINTGDQTITLTSDVTGSGNSSFVTTIAPNVVTLGKMATITTDSILGRAAAATGNVEVLTALPFAYTGDVTRPADSNATTIAADVVTFAKLQNITTDRLIGRDTAATGDPEEITVSGGLEFTGTIGIQRSALTGAVTATAGSNATALGSFTLAQLNTAVSDADVATGGGTATGINTGDQTSIVGITGTKAQFDTAVTDGNILYVGDITQYTDELAQDAVGAMVDTTLVYTDLTPLLVRAALTGAITASAGSNATLLGSFTTAQLNTALSDADVATGGGTATGINTGDNAVNTLYSGLVSNATHTGDATGATALTVVALNGTNLAGLVTGVLKNTTATGVPFISKVALTEPATAATLTIVNNQTLTVNGSATITSGTHSGTNTGDQTITNSSDATSHTVTLSSSGGSVQLIEGSNITLTTTGTSGAGIVTIASTGGTGTVPYGRIEALTRRVSGI